MSTAPSTDEKADNERPILRSSRPSRHRASLLSFPGAPPPSDNRPRSVHISADEYKAITDLVDLAKSFLEKQQQNGEVSLSSTQSDSVLDVSKAPKQDGPLDPFGNNFDAREWAKAFYRLRSDSCEVRKAGVAYRKLNVSGYGSDTAFQTTVGNAWWLKAAGAMRGLLRIKRQQVRILHDLEGVVNDGEMLCVLGPPGSGCSTFLRTMAGDTQGTQVAEDSHLNYRGVSADEMKRYFKGDAIYTAEEDVHFPALSVADTLFFAARARAPRTRPAGLSADEYATWVRDVTMAMLGIQHTMQTPVGGTDGDTVRGVSGGERKRVSIAEAALSFAPIQCWDNSTRGLDSAATVDLCKNLRVQSDIMGMVSMVAIYQAPEEAYELFDKVLVLYEGRQIYFGKTTEAKRYFQRLGFVCPKIQTTPDFLTSMTSPAEREGIVKPGYEQKVPRTPDEFAEAWRTSSLRRKLGDELDSYDASFSLSSSGPRNSRTHFAEFLESKKSDQSWMQRWKSPYTLSYPRQVLLCLWRALALLKASPQMTVMMLVLNLFQTLIVASVFFRLPNTAESIKSRSTFLFTAALVNAFGCVLEVPALYAKRSIVEKHVRYALYHASAEAVADLVMSLPYKLLNAITVNTIFYWMCNMRNEAGSFVFFVLVQFAMTLAVSLLFRLVASVTKSHTAAQAPSTIVLLTLALYTGFAVPPMYIKPYAKWIATLSPVSYGFEALMINELGDNRKFPCKTFVPFGPNYEMDAASMTMMARTRVCAAQGGVPGETFINGTKYINGAFRYMDSHRWRNVGVVFAFAVAYLVLHLIATEIVSSAKSKGEMLVFPRGKVPTRRTGEPTRDVEDQITKGKTEAPSGHDADDNGDLTIDRQTAIFHWSNVCYEVKLKKKETKRILDGVDGWCKPGTLTALMGVSGAGKTTLLDALASRLSVGVVTGEMLVDGAPRDDSFQQKTGYVKQQDQHLLTSTVREALTFSAVLRQPARFSHKQKIAYVDKVIEILGMEEYADAVVGVPGEGLNVEQRKKLTIGVELAARPALLLFLDEPTSGLDSQTSLSICTLLETLRQNGQAILCTIHQPSATLFERFDRLLLLARGGRTVYFGQIGRNAKVLVDYFVRNGGPRPKKGKNPAEYILEQVKASGSGKSDINWPEVWRKSTEYEEVKAHLAKLKETQHQDAAHQQQLHNDPPFAAPVITQFFEVTRRLAKHYWRTPSYVYAKLLLTFGSALFIGLSLLNLPNTQTGVTIQTIAIFMFLTTHLNLTQQIVPIFVSQRTLYEGREQPSRTYSWVAFMGAQMVVEMAYNALMAPPAFVAWYYLVGLQRNAAETNDTAARGGLSVLFMLVFFLQASTFAYMIGAAFDLADQAAGVGNLLFVMMFIFNGILGTPPKFWVWVYRVNPFTYLVEGLLGTGLANAKIQCADNEFLLVNPPLGQTCGEYLQPFIAQAGGYLADTTVLDNCKYCTTNNTNQVLAGVHVEFSNRWRDLGILFAYVFFNAIAAFGLYYIRVPKPKKDKGKTSPSTLPSPQDGSNTDPPPKFPMEESEKQAERSSQAMRAGKVLGSLRSSIHGGLQGLGNGGKKYWDDDLENADDAQIIGKEADLGYLSEGEEGNRDVDIRDFSMQRSPVTPQYWI
ncbi:ATPase [Colletotrichum abscissum]|uniref:ATPase n=1 Tax=Colletotrichum abscissum TaxID=1671311 RepID=A0A9P9XJ34_9PEZI|nr:ATPase [Colletotrichum abscissum]KAI3554860.1 ATPase [Colletotrichum abscissum]KAK1520902.1 ATPase [Colletotrichum abscissum]